MTVDGVQRFPSFVDLLYLVGSKNAV